MIHYGDPYTTRHPCWVVGYVTLFDQPNNKGDLTTTSHTKIVAVGGRLNDPLSPPTAQRPGDMPTVTELKASGCAGV